MRDEVVRFSRPQRVEHMVVMALFLVLALTGFPQKFYDAGWAGVLVDALGGITRVRFLHRAAGLLFALLAVAHVATALFLTATRRVPLSMVPARKDFQDAVTNLRYYLGLSDRRPRFDRFDYREKFEYWGLLLGAGVMVATGFILYWPLLASRVLSGELIPVAKVAHSNEGLMAFLVVIVWHVYNVHLAPEVFPFNRSIFTGRISREHLRRDHPLEYERLFPLAPATDVAPAAEANPEAEPLLEAAVTVAEPVVEEPRVAARDP